MPFEAAATVELPSTDVLDELERTESKATLREELLDVLDAESPIQLDSFTRIVGTRFGLARTSRGRATQMLSQLPSGYEVRGTGTAASCWPGRMRSADW